MVYENTLAVTFLHSWSVTLMVVSIAVWQKQYKACNAAIELFVLYYLVMEAPSKSGKFSCS